MYGIVDPSPLVSWFCEVAGAQMLMGAIAAWLLLGGGDVSTAFAWGSVPALVQGVQMLLNGSTEKLGFGTMAQCVLQTDSIPCILLLAPSCCLCLRPLAMACSDIRFATQRSRWSCSS